MSGRKRSPRAALSSTPQAGGAVLFPFTAKHLARATLFDRIYDFPGATPTRYSTLELFLRGEPDRTGGDS